MNTLGEFRISANAVAQEVGGELIVLDMVTERYLAIDRVGSQIWGFLSQGFPLVEVIDKLTALYGVDRSRIEQDVKCFVQQLEDLGLGTQSWS